MSLSIRLASRSVLLQIELTHQFSDSPKLDISPYSCIASFLLRSHPAPTGARVCGNARYLTAPLNLQYAVPVYLYAQILMCKRKLMRLFEAFQKPDDFCDSFNFGYTCSLRLCL